MKGKPRDSEQEAWLMYLRYQQRLVDEQTSLTMETRAEIAAQLTVAAMAGRVAMLLEKKK